MIDIELFIDSLSDLTKQNKKTYADGKTLTRAINNSCLELAEYLYSISEVNQRAIDLAIPICKQATVASDANGVITYPTGFGHILNLLLISGTTKIKCQRVSINQLGIINKIPSRRPDASKKRFVYYFTDTGINVLPAQVESFSAFIQSEPAQAKVEYTYAIVNGEPKQTLSSKIDIPFNNNAFNVLLYMVMEKLGFSSRDLLATEYAKLGIQKEIVKPLN